MNNLSIIIAGIAGVIAIPVLNTTTTVTSRLRKKLTMMGLFFKYLC